MNVLVTSSGKKSIEGSDYRLATVIPERKDHRCEIVISMLREGGSDMIRVADPVRVTFSKDASGAHKGLEIASGDGSVTSLRFRVAADPATLDGVLSTMPGE